MTSLQPSTLAANRSETERPIDLAQHIKGLLGAEREIVFIPNPGNAGDALINAAAWQLFDQCGISRRIVRPTEANARQVYMYPGGGNLIHDYRNARTAIEALLGGDFRKLIILPHTIRANEDLLRRMDERFHIFCRDRQSFAHVMQYAPNANAYLADDIALNLDIAKILDTRRHLFNLGRLIHQPRVARRYALWRRKIRLITPQEGVLRIMRVDVETRDREAAKAELDLSACYGAHFINREEAELVSHDFLTVLRRAREIQTDRLHVGIGASLLGKKVIIYDNNYGKNRAIFDLSMSARFPSATFIT